MKRFTLRLTEAEYTKLKTYCEEVHVSMNDVVRELIREWSPIIKTIDILRIKEQNKSQKFD